MKKDPILTGQTEGHIVSFGDEKTRVHREVVEPLKALSSALVQNGFELGIVSSFRSFDAQLKIWNAKATGQRTLLDAEAKPLEFSKLSPKEIVYAILRWSALPGLSRHHWGTDFDVIDKKSLPPGYQVQLVPSEFTGAGYFSKMHTWLDQKMKSFGFFRPYETDRGGVSPERWHLSYAPLAEKYLKAHSLEGIRETLESTELELKDVVLDELDEIYSRFFLKVDLGS